MDIPPTEPTEIIHKDEREDLTPVQLADFTYLKILEGHAGFYGENEVQSKPGILNVWTEQIPCGYERRQIKKVINEIPRMDIAAVERDLPQNVSFPGYTIYAPPMEILRSVYNSSEPYKRRLNGVSTTIMGIPNITSIWNSSSLNERIQYIQRSRDFNQQIALRIEQGKGMNNQETVKKASSPDFFLNHPERFMNEILGFGDYDSLSLDDKSMMMAAILLHLTGTNGVTTPNGLLNNYGPMIQRRKNGKYHNEQTSNQVGAKL